MPNKQRAIQRQLAMRMIVRVRRHLCADAIERLGQSGIEDLLVSAAKRNRAIMPSERSSGIVKPSTE